MTDEEKSVEQLIKELAEMRRQIAELKSAEEHLMYMSVHDALTGLPNRMLFNDRLHMELAHAERNHQMLAVMFLDLDRFKLVNDTLGHAMGDRLLKRVADRLKSCVRKSDTVARMGGDEFCFLLPEIAQPEDAVKIAKKILKALKKPWRLGGQEFYITPSIGIAVYPNDGQDADTLMKNADTAMYRAKEQGNNYQLYTAEMSDQNMERLTSEIALRRALERQEFVIHYQPQINTETGQIIGMEALVRWEHPERGTVFPAEFIPYAEETGLIVPIGEWVLRTACAQNKAWQDAGFPPLRVTVNLSARQFQQKDLVETVDRILKETGLDPRWLELEITETVAMQDVEHTISTLRELRDLGVRIAIDDFGTGYSSFNYLKYFPNHTLKIDKSFVRDVTEGREDAAITKAIIALAQNLNLKVIAEGVETEEQLAFLKRQQCNEIQGYLFSRPLPAEEFTRMLEKKIALKDR